MKNNLDQMSTTPFPFEMGSYLGEKFFRDKNETCNIVGLMEKAGDATFAMVAMYVQICFLPFAC
jgi:hypothetical protein